MFIHDCLEYQRNKHFNMKINTAPIQSFSEHAPSFIYRISMDTKGPITPPSQNKSYIHGIVDAFSHFVVPDIFTSLGCQIWFTHISCH